MKLYLYLYNTVLLFYHLWVLHNHTKTRKLTLIWVGGNSKTVKAKNWHFPAISRIWLETFVLNFRVSSLFQSPDIGQNSDGDIFDFRISGQSLVKENCHNSRTSYDINMKLGSVTKLDKASKIKSKKLTMTSCR